MIRLIFLGATIILLASTAGVSRAGPTEDYKLKQMCRKSAEEFVQKQTGGGIHYSLIINHYNKKRNVCFALTKVYLYAGETAQNLVGSSINLYDVDEGSLYGVRSEDLSDGLVCEESYGNGCARYKSVKPKPPECTSSFKINDSYLKLLCESDHNFTEFLKSKMEE
jgi:hypothetical protein